MRNRIFCIKNTHHTQETNTVKVCYRTEGVVFSVERKHTQCLKMKPILCGWGRCWTDHLAHNAMLPIHVWRYHLVCTQRDSDVVEEERQRLSIFLCVSLINCWRLPSYTIPLLHHSLT